MLLLKSLLELGTLISADRTLESLPLNNSLSFQNTLFVKSSFIIITSSTEIDTTMWNFAFHYISFSQTKKVLFIP